MKRLLALLLCSVAARVASASVPVYLAHEGRLLDATDLPVNGNHTFTFALYQHAASASDGSYEDAVLWTETDQNVAVTNGLYAVELGQNTPLDATKLTGRLYLQVSVDGAALMPRQWLSSAVFALRAGIAEEATHAAAADHATQADEATHATNADHALVADALADAAAGTFLQLGTSPAPQTGSASLTGTLTAGALAGDGAEITNVNAATVGGLAPASLVQLGAASAQTGSIHVSGSVTAGSLAGDGAGVTNVNAATLGGLDKSAFQAAGNYQPAGSYLNVVANPTAQTGSSTITGTMTAGKFVGDGSGLTGINATSFNGKPASAYLTSGNPVTLPTGTQASPPYTCNASTAGTIFFDTTVKGFYGCDGTSFQPLSAMGGTPNGSSQQLAATSCKALHANYPNLPSGAYWVAVDGTPGNTLQVYCDMATDGGGWMMVFKVNAGAGFGPSADANALWTYGVNGNQANETNAAMLTATKTTGAYVNHLLKLWNAGMTVTDVRTQFYVAGSVVKYVRYSGAGTNATNWFSAAKLVSSSWTDLSPTATVNYWSIPGDTTISRSFYVNANYGGCPADAGWMVVDGNPGSSSCPWENTGSPAPRLLYAPGSTVANWTTGQASAEAFAVLVR